MNTNDLLIIVNKNGNYLSVTTNTFKWFLYNSVVIIHSLRLCFISINRFRYFECLSEIRHEYIEELIKFILE